MEVGEAEKLLEILVDNVARIFRAGYGINSAESGMFAVIDILANNSGAKKHMLEMISRTLAKPDPGLLDEGMVPRELIELISHELRWGELTRLADKRFNTQFQGNLTLAQSDISQSIYDAQSDAWRDREFYSRYKN